MQSQWPPAQNGGETNFNDNMNNRNYGQNIHDMRDLMKSLAHEKESMLNASRSNFNLNRSTLFAYNQDGYNQFGGSSIFRGNIPAMP